MRALSYHLSLHFFVVDEARPMLWSCPFKERDSGMDISRDSVRMVILFHLYLVVPIRFRRHHTHLRYHRGEGV